MRVAVVCPYDMGEIGGVQRHTADLVERLRVSGLDAYIVSPGAPPDLGVDLGASVQVPGNESRSPISLSPGVVTRTRRAVRGADVVHVHEPMMPLVGPAALGSGLPRVATFHAAIAPWTERLYRALAPVGRHLLGDARVTAVSRVAAEGLPASWGPIDLIPNGVDVASFAVHVEREPLQAAFLGRDDPRKGLDVLLDAWAAVHARFPAARLVVIGATRETEIPGVEWRGRVDEQEKRRLLAASSVFVAPNLGGESFGIVLAEAMAAGCAIVASDLEAFRSVLDEGGVLVPPGDPSAFARAIEELFQDAAEVARLANLAGVRVASYDWPVVVDRYSSLYHEVADLAR